MTTADSIAQDSFHPRLVRARQPKRDNEIYGQVSGDPKRRGGNRPLTRGMKCPIYWKQCAPPPLLARFARRCAVSSACIKKAAFIKKQRHPFMERRIRVLVAKPGLDGHDRGAKVIARALRDAGMEVIYTGLRQTPEMIVNAALQEDVQVIGLSILSGAHNVIVPRVLDLLRDRGMDDVLVLVGGIIPDEDASELKKLGVAGIFQPGASLDSIVQFIRERAPQTAIQL